MVTPPSPIIVPSANSRRTEKKAASFRGRKLAGKSIPVPEGYQGISTCSSQHVYSRHVSDINSGHVLQVTEEELPRGDDGEEEKINIFKGLTAFDEITIWEHDATPDESTDGVIRAIEEWIGFANKVGSLIAGWGRDADTSSESTLIFTQLLQDVIMKKGETSIETINLFWNQVDGRESTPLYKVYNQLIEQLGLSLMQSQIKSSTRFRKESEVDSKTVFRSTIMPPDERLMKACQLDLFIHEFLKIIQL